MFNTSHSCSGICPLWQILIEADQLEVQNLKQNFKIAKWHFSCKQNCVIGYKHIGRHYIRKL